MMNKNTHCSHYKWPVRVYYEDTDAAGIVYYANYLKYMERARTEFLRMYGFEQDKIKQQFNCIFIVRSAHIDYLKPAYFNDQLSVTVEIANYRQSYINFKQIISKVISLDLLNHDQTTTNQPLVTGMIKIVCVNAQTLKPVRIPNPIKEVLTSGN